MRKRRRLANKMTIMVCAVLIAVSAFFYAPMVVSAEEISFSSSYSNAAILTSEDVERFSIETSVNVPFYNFNYFDNRAHLGFIDFGGTFVEGQLYGIDLSFDLSINTDNPCMVRNVSIYDTWYDFGNDANESSYVLLHSHVLDSGSSSLVEHTSSCRNIYYLDGKYLNHNNFYISFTFLSANDYNSIYADFIFNYTVNSITPLTGEESASYQQGYNAGYSAGEEAGESNGYSSGYSDGYEAGERSGYDSGFQAGSDSVDTQSYYDAGYQAGYDAGYSTGYDSGYDEGYDAGWSAYESLMSKWGADTSDYPILVYEKNLSNVSCEMEVVTNMPSVGHGQVNLCNLDININPSHTYKIVFDSVYPSTSVGDLAGSMNEQFNYNIGLFSIPWSSGESFGFVQGSSLSSVFRLEVYDYSAHYYEIGGENDVFQPWEGYRIYNFETIDVFVYDMGPSGDTQNHIANQTDQLTNGYDTSSGDSANSSLSTGLNEFETAENSLFATATSGMKDFTFFDFESVPAMLTAVTFITSIMGSWFEQAGGASGVGIVLSILFSVMLVSMVLGLYRLYQSAGHRAEARERHRERMEHWKKGK